MRHRVGLCWILYTSVSHRSARSANSSSSHLSALLSTFLAWLSGPGFCSIISRSPPFSEFNLSLLCFNQTLMFFHVCIWWWLLFRPVMVTCFQLQTSQNSSQCAICSSAWVGLLPTCLYQHHEHQITHLLKIPESHHISMKWNHGIPCNIGLVSGACSVAALWVGPHWLHSVPYHNLCNLWLCNCYAL